jgi:hypothetical protein
VSQSNKRGKIRITREQNVQKEIEEIKEVL